MHNNNSKQSIKMKFFIKKILGNLERINNSKKKRKSWVVNDSSDKPKVGLAEANKGKRFR